MGTSSLKSLTSLKGCSQTWGHHYHQLSSDTWINSKQQQCCLHQQQQTVCGASSQLKHKHSFLRTIYKKRKHRRNRNFNHLDFNNQQTCDLCDIVLEQQNVYKSETLLTDLGRNPSLSRNEG